MIKNVKIVIIKALINQSFTNISSLPKKYSTDLSRFASLNLYVLLICGKEIGDD